MGYYQKYRPQSFGQLDLNSVREIFEMVLAAGKVANAYLLVGPRGSGKTSCARILSRVVNCERNVGKKTWKEPCGECDACKAIKSGRAVDVMEIDAASHRGIDDIRELRDKVNLTSASLTVKVYIIDEVHMLTTEAFNALLKTLEEPPLGVLFILCTTEAHKVPETIVSRCVRVNFVRGKTSEVVGSLRRVCEGEGLEVEEGALEMLAAGVDGSFREGHKLLEQVALSGEKITLIAVQSVLGGAGGDRLERLLELIDEGKSGEIVTTLAEMEDAGLDPLNLITGLLKKLREKIGDEINGSGKLDRNLSRLVRRLVKVAAQIKISPVPFLPLEIVLLGESIRNQESGVRSQESGDSPAERDLRKLESQETGIRSQGAGVDLERVAAGWQELLARLQPRNHSVAGLLRSARPMGIEDKFLTIEVFYKFHKEQLEQEARRRMIEEEIAKLWGPISVRCVLGDRVGNRKPPSPVAMASQGVEDEIRAAEEVFGA